MRCVMKHTDELNSAIVYDRDFNYHYFGFKTLERSYLLSINGKVAERPQHMLMRVAVGIHGDDIEKAIETYNLMSQQVLHPRLPHPLQRRHPSAPAVLLLPGRHEGRQH